MTVRLATLDDYAEIARIYDTARQTMRASGNHAQWINGYPQREVIEHDIERNECYLIEGDDGVPHAVFMFSTAGDSTYDVIEDGAWLDDEPYGVIHRIGSDGVMSGVLPCALDFCTRTISNIRIDTHADNAIMRHVLEKAGFTECGTIYCHDGTPRIAYQLHA